MARALASAMTMTPAPTLGELGATENERIANLYGFGLVLGHVLCLLFLASHARIGILADKSDPVCWPFFEGCWRFRFSDGRGPFLLLLAYGLVISLPLAALAFGSVRGVRLGLAASAIALAAIVVLDYRFRQNQFYMLLWVSGVYLVCRNNVDALRCLIVCFYFFAGLLKVNREWISGAGLYNPLWLIPGKWTAAACAYVVVLELVISVGLLARSSTVFWASFGQLALFHVESLSQVGWFYPALMFAVLLVFVLDRGRRARTAENSIVGLMTGRFPKAAYATVIIFGICQIAPHLYSGDKTLNGQGRVFALHMFEAKQECEALLTRHYADGKADVEYIVRTAYPPRLRCDLIMYYSIAREACRTRPGSVRSIDFSFRAKRTTDASYATIVDAADFCSSVRAYRVFANNSWIKG